MFVTDSGIDTEFLEEVLLHDDISSRLIHTLVYDFLLAAIVFVIPRMTAPVLVVDSHREIVPREEAE